MKVMAMLAMLVGGLEVLNAARSFTGRGQQGITASENSVVVVAALAALLLVAAGVALLVRPRSATKFAGVAALICAIVFAGIATLRPFLSIASVLLGIGFPIALLSFLYRDSSHARSAAAR